MSDISIRGLTECERIASGIKNSSNTLGLFQVSSEEEILQILIASYYGEPLKVLYEDSKSINEYESAKEAYFFIGVPFYSQETRASSLAEHFIKTNFSNSTSSLDESIKETANLEAFVSEKMPTLSKLLNFKYYPKSLRRVYVKFDENKVPIFVSNCSYTCSDTTYSRDLLITSLKFPEDDEYKFNKVDHELVSSLNGGHHAIMVSKDAISFRGFLEEADGSISMLVNKFNRDFSQLITADNFDSLKAYNKYSIKESPLIINSEYKYSNDKSRIDKIPIDPEFFSVIFGGAVESLSDNKGLKSVFQLNESYKPASTETVSSRFSIISSKESFLYSIMKSSIGKSAQDSIRLTKATGTFLAPFISFIIEQILLHDMVFSIESVGFNNKNLVRHGQMDLSSCQIMAEDDIQLFADCFDRKTEPFKSIFTDASAGKSISLYPYLSKTVVGSYFTSHQTDFTRLVYKTNKNIYLFESFLNLLKKYVNVYRGDNWVAACAKLGIDNILFSNEADESTINSIIANSITSQLYINIITFPISSMFTLSTDSNEIIAKLLSCKTASDYYNVIIYERGKYIKHLKTICKENVKNTNNLKESPTINNDRVLLYLNGIVDAFELAVENLYFMEIERNS